MVNMKLVSTLGRRVLIESVAVITDPRVQRGIMNSLVFGKKTAVKALAGTRKMINTGARKVADWTNK